MSLQPQFSEYAPPAAARRRDDYDHGGNGAGAPPASAPYWAEPASSPYWDGAELADYYAGQYPDDDQEGPALPAAASPDILAGLTPEQQEAVRTTDGPLIIVAGPGAGKTLVIVRRIAYLVRDRNVAPWRILAVTFTNKAAREMRERLDDFLPSHSQAVTMSTFHALCARILRRHGERVGLGRNFTIYDQTDQLAAIRSAMDLAEVDAKAYRPRAILSRISAAKNRMEDSQRMAQAAYDAGDEYAAHWIDVCARVYRYYEEALARQNAVDFDDLLLRTVSLLENAPDVREQYHGRYQYLMIDEFQDTNLPQYRLIRLLTGDHRNLCVVGDVDQSIYSWRGANIENYEMFQGDFPGYRIKFDINFRSGQKILDAADSVLMGNTNLPASSPQNSHNPAGAPASRNADRQQSATKPVSTKPASSSLTDAGEPQGLWRRIRAWLWE